MQHRFASIDEFVHAAPADEIAFDPTNSGRRFAAHTRQRPNDVTRSGEMLDQMSADEARRTGDRNAARALVRDRCIRLCQEAVPPAARDASPFSSDAAYMRRACERDGLPDDVRGNAFESTSST